MSCTFRDESPGEQDKSKGRLKGIWLTMLYFVIELVTGILANSVAMIGDSFHMLTDALVQILTHNSRRVRNIPPRDSCIGYLSFGFRRLETMVTLFNIILLVCVKIWMLYGVYSRFLYGHHEINTTPVFFVATVGLIINLKVSKLWHVHEHDHGEDGIKSANLHIKDDLYGSMAVIASTAVIFVVSLFGYKIYWFDSLAAMFIFGLLWRTTFRIARSAAGILMEAAPVGLDFEKVRASIRSVYGVDDVLDLRISKIGSGFTVVTCRVTIKSHALHDFIPGLIEIQLKEEFPELKNAHFTVEPRCCSDPA